MTKHPLLPIVLALAVIGSVEAMRQRTDTRAGEWPTYGRDFGNSRYSPLDQIGPATLASLHIAWRWKADGRAARRVPQREHADHDRRHALFHRAAAGALSSPPTRPRARPKWTWSLDEGERGRRAPRRDSGRGVSPTGAAARRSASSPSRPASNWSRSTPRPATARRELRPTRHRRSESATWRADRSGQRRIGSSSPPLVFADTVVIGPALEVGTVPPSMKNVPGRILAIDAKTGALKWRFNTIPVKGEPGYETWENGSAEYTGNAGAWAPLTVDEARGYLYLPIEAPTGDYFGGHRHGNNLYRRHARVRGHQDRQAGVALPDRAPRHLGLRQSDGADSRERARSMAGRARSSCSSPNRRLRTCSIASPDSRSGRSSNGPFRSRTCRRKRRRRRSRSRRSPPRYDRQGVTIDDLIDFTPELRAEAVKAVEGYRLGKLFSPPSLAQAPDGTRGTIVLAGNLGGSNWEPSALDPDTGMLYVGSWTNPVGSRARRRIRSDRT